MNDPTQRYTPENDTGPMKPEQDTQDKHKRRGESEPEFTQMSPRKDEKKQYAIPDADPLDLTVAGLPQYVLPQGTQPAASTQPPAQHDSPVSIPQPSQLERTVPLNGYFAPPPPPAPLKIERPSPRSRPGWLLIAVAMVLLGGTLVLSTGLFVVLRVINLQPIAGDATTPPKTTEVAAVPGTPVPSPTVGIAIQPWDGNKRLTILLMGIDKRPNETGTAFRTDSLMLVSIDPATKSVGVLSVPRDLFVDIPTDTVVQNPYGLQRVNAAYVIGELARPGYGPQLTMQTVQYNLGIRINNYVVFEFNTVIKVIDAVGGIDVDVPSEIRDDAYPDMYYGYDPLYIPKGHIHMNGALALKYARTRHQTSDFDRAKRQQQVVLAVRDKILSANMAPQLVAQAPELWNQLSATTRSDLAFDQILRLALYLKDVPKENVHQGVIDMSYVTSMMYNGQSILLPERSLLGPLLIQIFGANYNS